MKAWGRLLLACCVIAGLAALPGPGLSYAAQGSISGVVWQDDNADGLRQAQEPGIAFAEVHLTGPAGELPSTKTDTAGNYAFTGLAPGSYRLSLGPTRPGTWIETYPSRNLVNPAPIDMSLAGDATVDIGLFPAAGLPRMVGSAWIDAEPIRKPEVRAFVEGVDCTLPPAFLVLIDPAPVSRFEIRVASAALTPGCGSDGSKITFTIDGQRANETAAWRSAAVEQLPPGRITPLPPPPAVAPPFANTQNIVLTVGAPFAAYFGRVIDAATGQQLDLISPPRFPGVDAYVEDTLCGSAPGYGLGGYVVVPSEQIKPGCGREGAIVRFYVDGALAPEQVAWKPGVQSQTLTLSSAEVPAGVFRIVISAEALDLPVSRAATGVDTLGQALGSISVLVNGTLCGQVDVSARQDDVVIELGRTGQPADCGSEGALITFVDRGGTELNTRMTLTKGTQRRLSNLAPAPPGGGSDGTTTSPSRGTIAPPDTGDAGLAGR